MMKKSNRFLFTPMLTALALVVVLPVQVLILATDTPGESTEKKIKKGAQILKVKGTKRHWKDVITTPLNMRKAPRELKPVKNMLKYPPIKKLDKKPDPVVQISQNGKARKRALGKSMDPREKLLQVSAPIISFAGLDFSGWGAGWPPDTVGDVGLEYYVQAVNTSIGIFQKSDGTQVSGTTFNDFFLGGDIASTPCDNDNKGDPLVLFDRYEERWFILDFAWYEPGHAGGTYFSIAVSDTSDPLGTWTQYAMQAHPNHMADYPKAGIWHDAIYITANIFDFDTSEFQYVQIWALNKSDLYSGTLNAQYITEDSGWSILPSNANGPNAPSPGLPNYMISMDANEFGGSHSDALLVWEYDVDWSNPLNTTWTGPTTLSTEPFGLTASNVPQPAPGTSLASLYGRLMNPAMYREYCGQGVLYVNHVSEYSGRRAERWYEVRINAGIPSIHQQGTYAPGTNHYWMGSIGGDQDGNIALGFSVSSASLYPSIRYTAQASIDATAGVLDLGEQSIIDGAGAQTANNHDRWGDYSAISIDPVDDRTFWYTNEYYSSNGTNWQTRIGSFKVKPDLWSKDSPADVGNEPNNNSAHFCHSEDIWVRNTNDGFANQVHVNPEYGQTNYIYLRVRNRDSEGGGIAKLYWAFPDTGLSWPDSWNFIAEKPTGNLAEGSTTILEFPWNPPNPGDYGSSHFCLLSRIETSPCEPYGMTFPEVASNYQNVKNNNNIVWKNVSIVDNILNLTTGEYIGGSSIISLSNHTKKDVKTRLEIVAVIREESPNAGNVLQWGQLDVDLGAELFNRWDAAGRKGRGTRMDCKKKDKVIIETALAQFDNLELKAGETFLVKFNFTPFKKNQNDKTEYLVDVIQYNYNGKEYVEVGGVRFVLRAQKTGYVIKKKPSFSLHLGSAVPIGNFADIYKAGFNIVGDIEIPLKKQFSLRGLLGFNQFKSKIDELDDTSIVNINLNLRYTTSGHPLTFFTEAGPGYYIFKDVDNKMGVDVGCGFQYKLSHRVWLEFAAHYNIIFTKENNTRFFHLAGGLIFRL